MANCSAQAGSTLRHEQGSTSLISLITVLACFLLASTYLGLAQADLRMTTRDVQARQALFLAEAGVELARASLAADPLWQPSTTYQYPTGSVSLSLTPLSPGYTVIATGQAGQATRTEEVRFVPGSSHWQITAYREVYN